MIVKVCGMRDATNVAQVAQLRPTMMGFILYPASPRYIGDTAPATPDGIIRVGVSVNQPIEELLQLAEQHHFDYLQLHGTESPEMCRRAKAEGLGVIKAISIASAADFAKCSDYDGVADYLLFDTKCAEHGGSGRRFDWSLLDSYRGSTAMLLSGGIDTDCAAEINEITHPRFAGVDLNSRFETSPAMKDINRLNEFLEIIKR